MEKNKRADAYHIYSLSIRGYCLVSISLDMLYYSIKIEKIKQKTALFNKKLNFL